MKNIGNSRRRSKRSRARKRRALAGLAALILVVLVAWFALHRVLGGPPHVARVARDAGALETPTPRPLPAPVGRPWTPAEIARVRGELRAIFAPVKGDVRYSLVVLDASGKTIYEDHADRAVAPASVQKLVVSFASLNLLGPSYRFHTILAASQGIGSDGALDGDLWLVGSGDPSLRSEDLRAGVAALARAGLRSVGRVVVDPSAMRGPEINPHWSAQDANEDYQTATSAVSLDGDTAEFHVIGTTPGAPARVSVVPKSSALHVSGEIETSGGSDDVIIAAMAAPNTFYLHGTIPAGVEEKYWLPVHDIPRYDGAVLDEMLREAGVTTARPPAVGAAPLSSVVLWDHRSKSLPALLKAMLYVSDNHYAEQLLRSLGGNATDVADDATGIAAETQYLHARGIPTPGMHVVDGSGLAESNRIAAITLARILSDSALSDQGAELYPLLPEGGKDGTLKYYDFAISPQRIHAKTGHLSDAASLAGYVDTTHHGRMVFAFMINDSPGDPDTAYVRAVDRLAAW
ncbi:MAG: D-alanyl-D-alanine carboxypeptidase/D-alanyl-D-alanine-endopeptidase [bacterium]|nr:D-alanyl-D-alanine carboxypeptidase/D-alanyl-D-alanine-endopeptidase [bacterium]